ncbi:hypothetical protein ACFYO1_35395 [Nocardia sp. NPDC006044]|uniref:hypothetical protein n=1 Tax=Nocardia sp. NPDC006044 TaxID=3364306 RepID=UPI003697ACFA
MIVVFIAKDIDVLEAGYDDSAYKPATFGRAYAYSKKLWPCATLGKTENLFITAHGDEDSIGDEDSTPGKGPVIDLNADQLAGIIKAILPGGYTGNIYISTCNSFKIAQAVAEKLGMLVGGDVYGTKKSIDYAIQGPSGSNWSLAG